MENNLDNPSTFSSVLTIDQLSTNYLEETRKWARFLSIMGFIMIGILVIIALFAGSLFSSLGSGMTGALPATMITIVYLLIALLYFFPVLYLYRFSVQMKVALQESNQESLSGSFGNLKSMFKFMGIMTIIVLALYALAFIFAIVAGTMMR